MLPSYIQPIGSSPVGYAKNRTNIVMRLKVALVMHLFILEERFHGLAT